MKIGIIGAGQLGRMLALSGYPLGQRFVFLDQSDDAPGAQVGRIIEGAFDDPVQLAKLAAEVDVITFDVENVPVDAVREIARTRPFLPPVGALGASQDRLDEKTLFRKLRIPTPEFAPVDSLEDLLAAAKRIGIPGVLKTRRLGYDGRGQFFIRKETDLEEAWNSLGSVPLIYEGFIEFSREVSIIGVRSTTGEIRCYPLSANTHSAGILRHTIAPYRNARLQKQAETHLKRILKHFDYAGVLTIEFFVPDWLKERPFLYLVWHMAIMPLIDLFITACEWLVANGRPPAGLWLFLILSFINGCVLEIGRKIYAPVNERNGVETYSSILGPRQVTLLWCASVLVAFAFLLAVGVAVGALRIIVGLAAAIGLLAHSAMHR